MDDPADSKRAFDRRADDGQVSENERVFDDERRFGDEARLDGKRRSTSERRSGGKRPSGEGQSSSRKRISDRQSTRGQSEQVVRRSFSRQDVGGKPLALAGGGLPSRSSRNPYSPRSQGGGLASLLPKVVLALTALAFVGIVIPNVFGVVKGHFDQDDGEGESAGSITSEFTVAEPCEIDYEPTTASLASMPAAAEGVTGFSLVADGTGYVPTMSADQQAAVQAVLDQYTPNNRTVGFAFVDLRTGSGYAYNVDADVYGASTFKAHVAVFACQNQVESGAIKQSAFRQSAEAAVVWSDNDSFYRLRRASNANGEAMRSWLSGMGLDPALGDDTFPTYSAREAATLWMNTYLYLNSGDPSLTSWLAGLLSTTNVSMVRDGVSGNTKLDPSGLAGSLVTSAAGAINDALPAGFMTAASLEATEKAEKAVREGKGSAVAPDSSTKNAADDAANAVREGLVSTSANPDSDSASMDSSNSTDTEEKVDRAGAYEYLGFGLDAAGDVTPDIVVYNKAGWINGNSVDSVCDAGIIAEGNEAYLMVIMTSAPDSTGNRQLVSDLASALWAARDTLQPEGLVKV